jgi:hypothetical protein
MKKETIDIDTSKNAEVNKGEPGLPVKIPLSIVRWLAYSIGIALLLIPFHLTFWQGINGSLLLGHFASQLNALIKK